jgi:hypothetical protein
MAIITLRLRCRSRGYQPGGKTALEITAMARRLTLVVLRVLVSGGLVGAPLAAQAVHASSDLWAAEPSTIVYPSNNTDLQGWEAYKSRKAKPLADLQLTDPILKGAIDLHAHFGPDTYDRQWDAFEIAQMAGARGMRGLVLKNHWTETAGLAHLVRKYGHDRRFEVFGGLALNATVGGINPQAVRYFAEVEGQQARIVWMPTHDSEHEVTFLGERRPYVAVSADGALLPAVLEVLDLIKQYDLTLSTGHVTPDEMLQIADEAKRRGIDRIIVTHPDMGPMFTDPTMEQLREVVALGGYVEVVASELLGSNSAHFIDMIRTLGPEHCFVASDSGLAGFYNHPDALVLSIRKLREAGFSEADLDLLFRKNPAVLVGLLPLVD